MRRSKTAFLVAALPALCLLLGPGPTFVRATELHVAPPAGPAGPPGEQARPRDEDGSIEHPYLDLGRALDAARAGHTGHTGHTAHTDSTISIRLAPGAYELTPTPTVEPTCGNCEDPSTAVPATRGLLVTGRGVRIAGAPDHRSVIRTNAGYGILFQDCADCALEGVVVTGGVRDTSGAATDAAVVVQRSSVRIQGCILRDNIGDSTAVASHVVGIMGICGREGSRIRAIENRILRNSWDGIALYRDAEAEIAGNVIDGVDLAVGGRVGGGRGVAIGCTWNARATIRGNLVRRYWKGIGLFVDADATVEANVVEHVATWGLSLWDAGRGSCRGRFRWNAVDSTGACGASIVREAEGADAGYFVENALTRTAQNPKYDSGEPYCFQLPIAIHALPDGFRIEENALFASRTAGTPAGPDGTPRADDLAEPEFRERARVICAQLGAYEATRASRFYRLYGAGGERPDASGPNPSEN
jgi:hypothetical protein